LGDYINKIENKYLSNQLADKAEAKQLDNDIGAKRKAEEEKKSKKIKNHH